MASPRIDEYSGESAPMVIVNYIPDAWGDTRLAEEFSA
jgi:hypothetical protein